MRGFQPSGYCVSVVEFDGGGARRYGWEQEEQGRLMVD
jgi:hypothetical protein